MSEESAQQEQPVEQEFIKLIIALPEEPGKLAFPVTTPETVSDIKVTLRSVSESQQYTAFDLQLKGEALSDEITIGDLVEEGKTEVYLSLNYAAYNEKTARDHLNIVRKLSALEPVSFYDSLYDVSGVSPGASIYEDLELSPVKAPEPAKEQPEETNQEEEAKESKIELSEDDKQNILDVVEKILEENSDISEFAGKPTARPSPTLRSLHISSWSPPTIQRKLKGDLFYLQCQTLEGETFHITAHVSGFFVNKSSITRFDGTLKTVASANGKTTKLSKSHSLLSLLQSLSPKFVEQSEKNGELLASMAPELYSIPSVGFLANPWLVKEEKDSYPDLGRSQENYLYGGLEGADLHKDYNDEFQGLREIGKPTLQEKVLRERLLTKTTFDFTVSAVKGALAIVRGELTPMNPTETPSQHIFLRNGIFYSYSVDASGNFTETGGDEAARIAASKDINGVRILNRLDTKGVSHLLTTIVDYAGRRILCQTPVPGLFNEPLPAEEVEGSEETPESAESAEASKKTANTILYGSSEEGTDVSADPEFVEKFKSIGEAFHIKEHKVWNKDGSKVVDVVTSMETKGMKGSDTRDYIIELYRTTPLDIEFIDKYFDSEKEDSYPHREVSIRNEGVEEWWRRQVSVLVKAETEKIEKEKAEKAAKGETEENEEQPSIRIDPSVFSLNPDAFSLSPAPTPELAKELKDDQYKVREVSKFISEVLVPEFVDELGTSELFSAFDGAHLSSMLHKQGINLRYLGKIASLALERKSAYLQKIADDKEKIAASNVEVEAKRAIEAEEAAKKAKEAAESAEAGKSSEVEQEKKEEEEEEKKESKLDLVPVSQNLEALYSIAVQEMIARGTKHFLRSILVHLPIELAPYVLAHVHNSLLASSANKFPQEHKLDPLLKEAYGSVDLSILETTAVGILSAIAHEVFIRYRFTLPDNWFEFTNPLPLFKEIAVKVGIQWKNKKYAFTAEELEEQIKSQTEALHAAEANSQDKKSKKKAKKVVEEVTTEIQTTTFVPEDIIAIVPVVKDSVFGSVTVEEIWELARSNLQANKGDEGITLMNETVAVYEQVYGPVHTATAKFYGQMGRMFCDLGITYEGSLLVRKSLQILERTTGIDSADTLLALTRVANAELVGGNYVNALKVYKRILTHWSVASEGLHPSIITTLYSIAMLLQRLQMITPAGAVLAKCLEFSDEAYGERSQNSALYRYQLGQCLLAGENLKAAGEEFKKAFEVFRETLGLEDKMTETLEQYSTQISNYLIISKQQEKYKKEAHAKSVKEARKIATQQQQAANKKNSVSPDPEIAEKSVDDILKFIEGNNGSSKKKNKKKHSKK